MGTVEELKEHEVKIATLSKQLERLNVAEEIDKLGIDIPELLGELSSELRRAELTVQRLNPIRSRLLITKEARTLSRVRGARRKVRHMEEDFRELNLE